MRWHYPRLRPGDTRTRRKFLWWPKRIGMEARWLECASWTELFQFGEWTPLNFITDEEKANGGG